MQMCWIHGKKSWCTSLMKFKNDIKEEKRFEQQLQVGKEVNERQQKQKKTI